jgi:hypothetical protein
LAVVVRSIAVPVQRRPSGAATWQLGGGDGSAKTFESLHRRVGAWRAILGPADSAAYVFLVVNAAQESTPAAPGMTG